MKRFTRFQLILFILISIGLSGCSGLTATTETAETNAAVEEISVVADEPVVAQDDTPVSVADGDVVTTQTYIDLYERLNPSVVNIRVVVTAPEFTFEFPSDEDDEALPDDHPEIPEIPEFPDIQPFEPSPQEGVGSGFIYDTEGHIVTNNHVIAGAEQIVVTFADDTEAEATLVGADPGSDLAVIKVDVDPDLLVPAVIGDSDSLRVGQLVAAIGNPFGNNGSMSTGIVSGLGRLLPGSTFAPGGGRFSIPDIIQTDTAINPGNSGGPLLNLNGEVIGVNTAIENPTLSNGGVGYAVPAGIVKEVVPQLIENGRVQHAWLGISGGDLSSSVAEAMDLDPDQRGAIIGIVIAGSPAEEAGLRGGEETRIDGFRVMVGGDIIIQIDNQPVNEFDDLLTYIVREAGVDQTVTLQILRDGDLQEVEVTLTARPDGDE